MKLIITKEFKKKDNLFICEECEKSYKSMNGFSHHISKNHGKKEYYDKWLKEEGDGFCKICRKETNFITIFQGYQKCCCKRCSNEYTYEQTKKGNLKKYGVENISSLPEMKEKHIQHNLEKYNVEYTWQRQDIKDKCKQIHLKNLGVENPFQSKTIKDKIKQTNLEKYGVEYPAQNYEIYKKQKINGFKLKTYNSNLYYNGSYELDFLEKYYTKFTDIRNGPTIIYIFEDKEHYYFSDFYIPSLNLIIEIKSSWIIEKQGKDIIKIKEKAIIAKGLNYIMIVDKNYDEFNNLIIL
jgi:hypothetical protein